MYEEFPFLKANELVLEGSAWLRDMLLPEGSVAREAETNEDSWEQAQAHFSRAVAALEERSHEKVEEGGEEVEGHGWVPHFRVEVVDPKAAAALAALTGLLEPVLRLHAADVASKLTEQYVQEVESFFKTEFAENLALEQRYYDEQQDSQPEPY